MCTGLASITSERWDNLKTLLIDPTIRLNQYSEGITSLLDATGRYEPFKDIGCDLASTITRAWIEDKDALVMQQQRKDQLIGEYHTAVPT